MPTTNNITQGLAIKFKGQDWLIIGTQFEKPGKGQAFTRAKLKNLKTGQILDNTFKCNESVETIDVQRKKCQFLYNDGNTYHFMDNDSYEQFTLEKDAIREQLNYLLDGTQCHALHIEGKPISIQLPPKMEFTVIQAPPGVKGDTATGGSKEVTIETGTSVKVPLFINEGEKIIVNTESGEYMSKA